MSENTQKNRETSNSADKNWDNNRNDASSSENDRTASSYESKFEGDAYSNKSTPYAQGNQNRSNEDARGSSYNARNTQRRGNNDQYNDVENFGYQGSSYGAGRNQQGRIFEGGEQFTGNIQGSRYGGEQFGGRNQNENNPQQYRGSQFDYTNSQQNSCNQYGSGYGLQNNGNQSGSGYGQQNSGNQYGSGYGQQRGRQELSYGRGNETHCNNEFGSSRFGQSGSGSLSTSGRQTGEHKGKGPKGYQRSDERIKEDINDRLSDDEHIDASNTDVTIENGEVTLSGTVNSKEAKRRAEDAAEAISGIKNIENRIRVTTEKSDNEASGSAAEKNTTYSSTNSANNVNHNSDEKKRNATMAGK